MAAAGGAKAEAFWREAWEGSAYSGTVELAEDQERLVIRCDAISAEYGTDAEILDDGRTTFVAVGDRVAFGVVEQPGKVPVLIAVNVWRDTAKPKKRKAAESVAAAERKDPSPTETGGFDYSAWGSKAFENRELLGLVRNQSAKTGDYFIGCQEVWEVYQRDAKILQHELPRGISIGDAVSFKLDAPTRETSAPCAREVRKVTGAAAEAVVAQNSRRKGDKGKGKGGKSGKRDKEAPERPKKRMLGIVKKRSINTGRHFVLCQDISDTYGVDAQIPDEEMPEDVKVGDRISFDIDEPPERKAAGHQFAPFARNVRRVGVIGSAGQSAAAGNEEGAPADQEEAAGVGR